MCIAYARVIQIFFIDPTKGHKNKSEVRKDKEKEKITSSCLYKCSSLETQQCMKKKSIGRACLYKHLQQNSLYHAACIAKFEGILGFSVLSII